MEALSPLETVMGGTGAMYVMGKLPDGVDDQVSIIVRFEDFFIHCIYFIFIFVLNVQSECCQYTRERFWNSNYPRIILVSTNVQ